MLVSASINLRGYFFLFRFDCILLSLCMCPSLWINFETIEELIWCVLVSFFLLSMDVFTNSFFYARCFYETLLNSVRACVLKLSCQLLSDDLLQRFCPSTYVIGIHVSCPPYSFVINIDTTNWKQNGSYKSQTPTSFLLMHIFNFFLRNISTVHMRSNQYRFELFMSRSFRMWEVMSLRNFLSVVSLIFTTYHPFSLFRHPFIQTR